MVQLNLGSVPLAKELNPSLTEPPLKFKGSFAKLGLTLIVKLATGGG